MVLPDVNVLIYAFREDTAHHDAALTWLTDRLQDPGEEVIVPDLVWVGFARICTNGRIFNRPSSVQEVAAFAAAVIASPTYRMVAGLSRGIDPLFALMARAEAGGDLVTDAYIAAIALQLGATIATYDRDFRRFDDVRLVTPGP